MKFGDVVKNANYVERDPIEVGIERIVGLEHLDPENLHVSRWNSPEEGTSFTRKFVPGQTLFGKRRAYQRKVAFAEFEGICSGDILTFEPKNPKALLPELLPFICQTDAFFDHALGTSSGSLSPRTSWSALKAFELPLPPIKEQKRIAEILWAADEAVEKMNNLLTHSEEYLKSLYQECFLFPKNNIKRLKDIASITMGQSPESKYCGSDVKGIPFYQGCTDFTDIYPEVTTYCSKPKKTAKQNDILISVRAPVGEVNISKVDCCIGRGIAAISPKLVSKEILFHLLIANKQKITAYEQGSTFKAINKNDLENLQLNIPEDDKLKSIEELLKKHTTSLQTLKSHITASANLRFSLLNTMHCWRHPCLTKKTLSNRWF